jgi:hypothetical protein
MTPTNLPDLYSRVVAKRPELAVKELTYRIFDEGLPGYWFALDAWECASQIPEYQAASLILAKWVEALPPFHVLCRFDSGWEVYEQGTGGDYQDSGRRWTPTPLEALAAFWLECEA